MKSLHEHLIQYREGKISYQNFKIRIRAIKDEYHVMDIDASEWSYATLAGWMDSDGSICLIEVKKYHYVRVRLSQSNSSLINSLKKRFGGCAHKNTTAKCQTDHWLWSLTGNKALQFLKNISPYLRHRQEISTYLIEYHKIHGKYSPSAKKHSHALNTSNSQSARAKFINRYQQTPEDYFKAILK